MLVKKYQVILNDDRVPFLEKEWEKEYPEIASTLSNPKDVYDLAVNLLRITKLPEEHVYMFALTSKSELLGIFEASMGMIDAAALSPREILQRALLINAARIIVMHNHTSGKEAPSKCDIDATNLLNAACKNVGILLDDHIIAGEYDYYSFRKGGLITD